MSTQNPNVTALGVLAEELLSAWNEHDVNRVLSLFSPNCVEVDINQASPHYGLEGVRKTMRLYLDAFPDLHFTKEEAIAEDDRLVILWTAEGTHAGAIMHIPATGRRITVRGMSLLEVERERIRRAIYVWDAAAMLRGIGLLPELSGD